MTYFCCKERCTVSIYSFFPPLWLYQTRFVPPREMMYFCICHFFFQAKYNHRYQWYVFFSFLFLSIILQCFAFILWGPAQRLRTAIVLFVCDSDESMAAWTDLSPPLLYRQSAAPPEPTPPDRPDLVWISWHMGSWNWTAPFKIYWMWKSRLLKIDSSVDHGNIY